MVSRNQCKAARAMLGWTIDDLAEKADISRGTVLLLEKGSHNIKKTTISAVLNTFDKADIEFIGEHGVNKKTDTVELLMGDLALPKLWNNITQTFSDGEGGEVLITNVDEKRILQENQGNLIDHLESLKKNQITAKLLSCEGDNLFLMPKKCYRWISKDLFTMGTSTYIYADKVAFQLWGEKMIVLIHSKDASNAERQRFNLMWKNAKVPS